MSEQQQLEQRRVDFEITNFVGVFKNAFTKEFCESVISQYEEMVASGHGQTRFQSNGDLRTYRDDTQLFADDVEFMPLRKVTCEFNTLFWNKFYPIYEQEYSVIKDAGRHANFSFKVQKTKVGGDSKADFENGLYFVITDPNFRRVYTKMLKDAGEDTTLATRDMTDKEKMKFFNLD